MSLLADETAGDLPVRDVGLMRGGLMPAVPGLMIHYSALKVWKSYRQLELNMLRSYFVWSVNPRSPP